MFTITMVEIIICSIYFNSTRFKIKLYGFTAVLYVRVCNFGLLQTYEFNWQLFTCKSL